MSVCECGRQPIVLKTNRCATCLKRMSRTFRYQDNLCVYTLLNFHLMVELFGMIMHLRGSAIIDKESPMEHQYTGMRPVTRYEKQLAAAIGIVVADDLEVMNTPVIEEQDLVEKFQDLICRYTLFEEIVKDELESFQKEFAKLERLVYNSM
jgi:hypothetical protein